MMLRDQADIERYKILEQLQTVPRKFQEEEKAFIGEPMSLIKSIPKSELNYLQSQGIKGLLD